MEILANLGMLKLTSIINIVLVLLSLVRSGEFFPCKIHPPKRHRVYNIFWESINDFTKRKRRNYV